MIHYGRYIHPKSWTEIARAYADHMMESAEYEIAAGRTIREEASKRMQHTISNSVYMSRHWMMNRAAKRLHRKGWI